MFKRLFGGKKQTPEVRMPDVDALPGIDGLFETVRKAARGEGELPRGLGRNVVIVTPGRMLMFQPCPPPGSMPQKDVASMEAMISPAVKRNVAAISYTELNDSIDVAEAIPFLGILIGLAYIGHAVWIFEGHRTALAAGCKDADVLIVDGAMIPHLQEDWAEVARSVMRTREIYLHDRASYSLRKVR